MKALPCEWRARWPWRDGRMHRGHRAWRLAFLRPIFQCGQPVDREGAFAAEAMIHAGDEIELHTILIASSPQLGNHCSG